MAMNREQKRLLQRQGYVGEDGEPSSLGGERAQPGAQPQRERTLAGAVPARDAGRAAQGGLADQAPRSSTTGWSCWCSW